MPIRSLFERFAAFRELPRAAQKRLIRVVGNVLIALGLIVLLAAIYAWRPWEEDKLVLIDLDPRQELVEPMTARALAAKYAPEFRFDSREAYRPISRGDYVSLTELKQRLGRGRCRLATDPKTNCRLVDAAPTLESLPKIEEGCPQLRALSAKCYLMLDVRDVHPSASTVKRYDALERTLRSGNRPVVYWRVTRYYDSGHYAIQYWLLYIANYRLNFHEADWEQVIVHLDEDRNPKTLYYSSHGRGSQAPWRDTETGHPTVYVSLGGHANYFRSGRHEVPVRKCIYERFWLCFGAELDDITNGQSQLAPGDYALARLGGRVFGGDYSSGNFIFPERVARFTDDAVTDPRTRSAWANPLARLGSAPEAETAAKQ